MTIISALPDGSGDAIARLIASLQREFGAGDVGAIAARILQSERADFHWNARVRERYLGQHCDCEFAVGEEHGELARIAFVSTLDGRWHAGICLVDGDGNASDLLCLRSFHRCDDAEDLFLRAR